MDVDEEFNNFFGDLDGEQRPDSDSEKENDDDVPTDADVLNRIMKKSEKDGGKRRGATDRKRRPNPKLGPNEITGNRGISALFKEFKDYKVNPDVNEYENLEAIMKRVEHWGHLLFPRLHFDDLSKKLDQVGQKAPVKLHMRHMRNDTGPYDPESDMFIFGDRKRRNSNNLVQSDEDDNARRRSVSPIPPANNGSSGHVNDVFIDDYFNDPDAFEEMPSNSAVAPLESAAPSLVSQPSAPSLTDEQKKRIEENKRRAFEIREKRLKFLEDQKKEEEHRTEAEEKKTEEEGRQLQEEEAIDEDEALRMLLDNDE